MLFRSLMVTGFAKVEAAIGSGSAIALIHALDAAADGVRKLDQVAHRPTGSGPLPTITTFTAEQLSLALGGTNVIHAALLAGRLSEEALVRAAALVRYRIGSANQARSETTDA